MILKVTDPDEMVYRAVGHGAKVLATSESGGSSHYPRSLWRPLRFYQRTVSLNSNLLQRAQPQNSKAALIMLAANV